MCHSKQGAEKRPRVHRVTGKEKVKEAQKTAHPNSSEFKQGGSQMMEPGGNSQEEEFQETSFQKWSEQYVPSVGACQVPRNVQGSLQHSEKPDKVWEDVLEL